MRHRTTSLALAAVFAVIPTFDVKPARAAFGDHALRKGSHGREVRVLQRWLRLVGVPTHVDGVFGRKTVGSVRRYERRNDMRVDGRVSRPQARGLRTRAQAAFALAHSAATVAPAPVEPATLAPDGRTALAPASAPDAVKAAIAAANAITRKPYRFGGGHGRWEDSGYDCSGSVSYALHGAGLLDETLDSSGLGRIGSAGVGQWITVYAKASHAYVVIAGLRFDTSGRGEDGPRWRGPARSARGYRVRHLPGL